MTLNANSKIAGFTLLFYITVGIIGILLSQIVSSGSEGISVQLEGIARHQTLVGVSIICTLLGATCAIVLAVTMFNLTQAQDHELAMMALCFRLSEGIILFALSPILTLGLQSIATKSIMVTGSEAVSVKAIGDLLLKLDGLVPIIPATSFAIGSTIFSYLFLRSKSIPRLLALLGVFSSGLLVFAIPMQLSGFLIKPITNFIWIPMFLYEVTLGIWLLIKGVNPKFIISANQNTQNEF